MIRFPHILHLVKPDTLQNALDVVGVTRGIQILWQDSFGFSRCAVISHWYKPSENNFFQFRPYFGLQKTKPFFNIASWKGAIKKNCIPGGDIQLIWIVLFFPIISRGKKKGMHILLLNCIKNNSLLQNKWLP